MQRRDVSKMPLLTVSLQIRLVFSNIFKAPYSYFKAIGRLQHTICRSQQKKGAIRCLTDGSFYDMFSGLSDELDGVTATVGLPVDNVDAGTEETDIGSFAGFERQHLATAGVINTRREIEV